MKQFIIIILCICCSLFTQQTLAQSYSFNDLRIFKKGQGDGFIGLGLLPTYLMDGAKIVVPPINIGADYMVGNNISLGVIAGHSISESKPKVAGGDLKSYRNELWMTGIRAAAHCTKFDNLDIYGGFSLTYNYTRVQPVNGSFGALEEHLGIKPRRGRMVYAGYMGVKYSCCGLVSFFGELGLSSSLVTVGVAYRVK